MQHNAACPFYVALLARRSAAMLQPHAPTCSVLGAVDRRVHASPKSKSLSAKVKVHTVLPARGTARTDRRESCACDKESPDCRVYRRRPRSTFGIASAWPVLHLLRSLAAFPFWRPPLALHLDLISTYLPGLFFPSLHSDTDPPTFSPDAGGHVDSAGARMDSAGVRMDSAGARMDTCSDNRIATSDAGL